MAMGGLASHYTGAALKTEWVWFKLTWRSIPLADSEHRRQKPTAILSYQPGESVLSVLISQCGVAPAYWNIVGIRVRNTGCASMSLDCKLANDGNQRQVAV